MLSASGDKTSKIGDINVNSVVSTFTMGSNVLDWQLGCLWHKDHLLSISLCGTSITWTKTTPALPLQVINDHSKSIQCLTVHENSSKSYFGSHDDTLITGIPRWENDSFAGKGHMNQVSRMTVDESKQLVSCSTDDMVLHTNLTHQDYSRQGVMKPDVQSKCVAFGTGEHVVVVCMGTWPAEG